MKLRDLYEVIGSGEPIRIGAEDGRSWLVDTTTIHLDEWGRFDEFIDRTVVNIYTSDGRYDCQSAAQELGPAICVIVEGPENGTI